MRAPAKLQIVWFKRDLRTTDNRALARAAQAGTVLPLFVVEPALWSQPDMSARHWAFASECLAELREGLGSLGQPLAIRIGDVVETLDQLHTTLGIAGLWSHEETGNALTFARDLRVADWCRANCIPWHEDRLSGVIRRIATLIGWALRWDAFMAEPESLPPKALQPVHIDPGAIPSAKDLGLAPDPCPDRQPGGRMAGLTILESFLHQRGAPYRKAMSSPVTGFEHCSRVSPYLAWGALGMRETAQATWARQRDLKQQGIVGGWRGSMSSFSGRLHWRDHFTQKLEDEPRLEHQNLHRAYDGLRPREPDAARLHAWAQGETGLPFVDACMRALRATGWMNFRMRAMLMATASYHLWLDWRRPGEHLARLFTDYEPGIHWPQVQMQSGTTGINTVRIYNPVKQGQDQDPDGTFTRAWVPELATVPDKFLQTPWKWEGAASILGKSYPEPVVDHIAAARDARDKVWSVRRGAAFRQTAQSIQSKHGSRKSGIPNRGQRAARDAGQMSLPLEDGA
ncbi:MAG: FAD-binding domain-containing protein [Paracoccaceae bacterium]